MISRYLAPNREFVPATGCRRTGRVVSFHQLPKSEWLCPDQYPSLPRHEHFNNYAWWRRGLGTPPTPGGLNVVDWLGIAGLALGGVAAIGALAWYLK